MATYYKYIDDNHGNQFALKEKKVNLLKYKWSLVPPEEFEASSASGMSYEEYVSDLHRGVPIYLIDAELTDLVQDADPAYAEFGDFILIDFDYAEDDDLEMFPMATALLYPSNNEDLRTLMLSEKEKEYFTNLVRKVVGNNESPEMQNIMISFHKSVDKDVMYFLQDARSEREILPITVGYMSDDMQAQICASVKKERHHKIRDWYSKRVVLYPDALVRLLKFSNTYGDYPLADDDIGRLPYVLANFDRAVEQHGACCQVTKQIGNKEYVVDIQYDNIRNRLMVTNVYWQKVKK